MTLSTAWITRYLPGSGSKPTLKLLDETKDNGFPLTLDPNILLEMISLPNIVSKVLSAVTGPNSSVSDTLSGAAASYAPWRAADPKYSTSEPYVDLEEMDAL